MQVMSRRALSRIVLAGLLLISTLCLRAAFANAGSVTTVDVTQLLPSDAPGLLGPINEKGRVGWECKPERAASASSASAAELPLADSH